MSCQQAAWYGDDDDRRARLLAAASAWKSSHRELANEYNQRRRAVTYGADAERIDFAEVWIRDGGNCWLCELSIDPALHAPDPGSRSLDHVIPVSKGGSHTFANVALAHLRCNISKKDKVLEQALLRVAA